VGPRCGLNIVVKRKIPNPCRDLIPPSSSPYPTVKRSSRSFCSHDSMITCLASIKLRYIIFADEATSEHRSVNNMKCSEKLLVCYFLNCLGKTLTSDPSLWQDQLLMCTL